MKVTEGNKLQFTENERLACSMSIMLYELK